ncbi:putative transcriptional regulatory protein pdtaR [bacterium BMS3Abin15]|nr:putative transcriptional regulatory protein pdtaR [bacterium BMS3Abin15]HDZ86006.1 response regulator [Candidatus Moranbacteria bacterium]
MGKKIVIIEDDNILQDTLKKFLSTKGYEVSGAINGEDGVELVKKENPNLLLLDIVLPKKDGFGVIKDLKADESTKNIPIVLLTNLGNLDDVQKALDLGATTYLIKADYKLEEIVQKIEETLN